jgi:hypothetical protein
MVGNERRLTPYHFEKFVRVYPQQKQITQKLIFAGNLSVSILAHDMPVDRLNSSEYKL